MNEITVFTSYEEILADLQYVIAEKPNEFFIDRSGWPEICLTSTDAGALPIRDVLSELLRAGYEVKALGKDDNDDDEKPIILMNLSIFGHPFNYLHLMRS
jgi:hypothetical protein